MKDCSTKGTTLSLWITASRGEKKTSFICSIILVSNSSATTSRNLSWSKWIRSTTWLALRARSLSIQRHQNRKNQRDGCHQRSWYRKTRGARVLNYRPPRSTEIPRFIPSRSLVGQCQSNWYRSCYDEGKRVAETLFFDYHRQNKVDIRVARIFNTYGPHMHPNDGRVVSNFIVQALMGNPLTIYGDGTQTRSSVTWKTLWKASLS